jgi:hypothetical protein
MTSTTNNKTAGGQNAATPSNKTSPVTSLADAPIATPLYRCLVDQENHVIKYLIAYRSVTIFPFLDKHDEVKLPDGVEITPPPTPDVEIPLEPYLGTVGLTLGEASKGQPNVEIHGEDIYLYLGSHFWFPSKNVTITANRIFAISNPKAPNSSVIQIDCSGAIGAGPEPRDDVPPAGNNGVYNWGRGFEPNPPSTPGRPGTNGKVGNPGQNGGSIRIIGDLQTVSMDPNDNCVLYLNVHGGIGGPGQDGVAGSKGGEAWLGHYDKYVWYVYGETFHMRDNHTEPRTNFNGFPDVEGGAGGNGGDSGQNGTSGSVLWHVSASSKSFVARARRGTPSTTEGSTVDENADFHVHVKVPGGAGGTGGPYGGIYTKVADAKDQWTLPGARPLQLGTVEGDLLRINDRRNAPNGTAGRTFDAALDQGSVGPLKDVGSARNAVHLMMIIQRLNFEYHMTFGTQPSAAANAVAKGRIPDIQTTLKWLDDAIQSLDGSSLISGRTKTAYEQFLRTMKLSLDYYGNPFNMVPSPTVEISAVERDITILKRLEDQQQLISDAISTIDQDRSRMKDNARDLFQEQDKFEAATTALVQQLDKQFPIVQSLQDSMRVQKQNLVEAIKKFANDASHYFKGCTGWEGVMTAVGSVMMFASPESGAAFAVGGLLTVAASAKDIKTNVDPDGKDVKPSAILKSIHQIEADVEGLTLQEQLQNLTPDSLVRADPNVDLLTVIVTDRTKFLNLCDQYFDEDRIPSATTVKADFDYFIATVQSCKHALEVYNKLAVQYAQAKSDEAHAKDDLDLLALGHAELTTAKYDLLFIYFTQAVVAQKARTIRTLYNGVRAYNCASLQSSDAFRIMSSLGSFDNLDSDTLYTAFQEKLRSEIVAYNETTKGMATYVQRKFSVTKSKNPFLFNRFVSFHSFSLLPVMRSRTKYGMLSEWWDIRLQDFSIYLIGATRKGNDQGEEGDISVSVTFGSVFTVLDEKDVEHDFQVPEESSTFTYTYTDPNDIKTMTRTSSIDTYATEFKFALSEGTVDHYITPLHSPFIRWAISVDENEVDLSGLTEVRLLMDVKARTKAASGKVGGTVAEVDSADADERSGAEDAVDNNEAPPTRDVATIQQRPLPKAVLHVDGIFISKIAIRQLSIALTTGVAGYKIVTHNLSNRDNLMATAIGNSMGKLLGFEQETKPMSRGIPSPLESLGSSFDLQAKNLVNSSQATLEEILRTNVRDIHKEVEAAIDPGKKRDGATFARYKVNKTGHLAETFGIVDVGVKNSKRLVDPKIGPYALLGSFPNARVMFISPEHSAALAKTEDKLAYITQNEVSIREQEKEMIANGTYLKGCFIRLGGSGLIGVQDIQSVKDGPLTTVSITAVTTEKHQLDGTNRWSMTKHESRPNEIIFHNVMVGRHASLLMDLGNCVLGERLMATTWQSTRAWLEASDGNVEFVRHLQENYKELYARFVTFNSMDNLFGHGAASYREVRGTNMVFTRPQMLPDTPDITADTVVSGDLRESSDDVPGFLQDGVPIVATDLVTGQITSAADTGSLSPLTRDQAAAAQAIVDDMIKLNRSDEDIARIKDDVNTIADRYIKDNALGADNQPRSTEAIYNELVSNSTFGTQVKQKAQQHLMDDDTLAAVADEMSSHSAFASFGTDEAARRTISHLASQISYRRSIEELYKPDGYISNVTRQRIEAAILPAIQALDVDALIDAATKELDRQNNVVKQAQVEREKLDPSDPKLVEADRAISEAKEALARTEEQQREAEELRQQKENAEERRNEMSKREQAERDRVFRPEEQPHPVEKE